MSFDWSQRYSNVANYGARSTSKRFLVTFHAIVSLMIDTKIGFLETLG